METIKEEKKADLEQLLNSLIDKGWIPFGIYGNWDLEWERICIEEQDEYTNEYRLKVYWINVDYVEFNWLCDEDKHFSDRFSLREIVSKWSWLWQFVCKNGMYKKEALWLIFNDERAKNVFYKIDQFDEEWDIIQAGDMEWDSFIHISEPEYRLIESALKDESELEDFLLSNIKVEW